MVPDSRHDPLARFDPFSRFAYFIAARDASFVALAGGLLMVAYSFDPPLALDIGGSVALLYGVVMVLRALRITGDRVVQTEPWTVLKPQERPVGDEGRRRAAERLCAVMLAFAKNASAVACVLFAGALLASLS
ncbi:MAG TPA: hypothetical protein VHA55_10045 [Pseudorhodoplanes sp.]|jgi:hypothetical protein|nr:hypothetical protein [Pseudorhodoplanes sp.]